MMRCFLVILIALTFNSCKKDRYKVGEAYMVDPLFEPTTTVVDVFQDSISGICIYENNKLLAQIDSNSTLDISWHFCEEGTGKKYFLSDHFKQILTISGKYEFKSEGFYKGKYIDTLIKFDLNYCPASISFPDAFKPNGDGEFDFWGPIMEGVEKVYYSVIDQKGNVLFESSLDNEGVLLDWDGESKGVKSPAGTYKYRSTGTLKSGYQFEFTGTFELIR